MTPTSPEQFLREFLQAVEIADALDGMHGADVEKTIKGWSKLLKLREDAARVDEHRLFRLSCYGDGESGFMQVHMKTVDERLAELTTPNNTTNTLEDGVTE